MSLALIPWCGVAECRINCHKKCQMLMPNLCGINQKILAEALDGVSKTKSQQTPTKTPAQVKSPQAPQVSGQGSDEEDEDADVDYEALWNATTPGCPVRQRSLKRYTVGDFSFVKVLGKGSFGKVISEHNLLTYTNVCIYFYFTLH